MFICIITILCFCTFYIAKIYNQRKLLKIDLISDVVQTMPICHTVALGRFHCKYTYGWKTESRNATLLPDITAMEHAIVIVDPWITIMWEEVFGFRFWNLRNVNNDMCMLPRNFSVGKVTRWTYICSKYYLGEMVQRLIILIQFQQHFHQIS